MLKYDKLYIILTNEKKKLIINLFSLSHCFEVFKYTLNFNLFEFITKLKRKEIGHEIEKWSSIVALSI